MIFPRPCQIAVPVSPTVIHAEHAADFERTEIESLLVRFFVFDGFFLRGLLASEDGEGGNDHHGDITQWQVNRAMLDLNLEHRFGVGI